MICKKVVEIAISKRKTLATVESITGGMVSMLLSSVPGASKTLIGAIVTYQDKAKIDILGIDKIEFDKEGAISESTAKNMAEKGLPYFHADICLATTGIAGPSVVEGKPIGLVYIAASTKKTTIVKELHLKGSRNRIRKKAAIEVLKLAYSVLQEY